MLGAIASLFGYLMNFIYMIVQNYGIAIIIFTLLVKLLLLPLTIKQQKSLEKAQEMQPLLQELQRKYGQDQQKFAEEYQKLLHDKNMSVMSSTGCTGCLINFIQLPILLAMFYMMASPLTHIVKMDEADINKYKEEVNALRANQAVEQILSSGDLYTETELNEKIEAAKNATYVNTTYYELDIIKEKEALGVDIDFDMDFLGINLCDIASTNKENKFLMIIPVLSTIFTYLSLYISTSINKKKGVQQPKTEDMDVPMPDMRLMNIMMPIMMGYVAYSVPQGVGLYWATSNFLGIIQLVALRLVFKEKDASKSTKKETKVIATNYKFIEEESDKATTNLPAVVENTKKHKKSKNKSKKKKKK